MPTFSIRLEHDIVKKIEQIARLKGTSRSAFVREVLKKAIEEGSRNPVQEACQTMRQGKKPRVKVNWEKIYKSVYKTEPEFRTAEEAIDYSRRRISLEEEKNSN